MKRLKILLIIILTIFSFYYTDKIIYLSKLNDPLMKEINKKKNKYRIDYVNGIVTDKTILLGRVGKEVNLDKSYNKMKEYNMFDEKLLEFENIYPDINKVNNRDKLIIGKNTDSKDISFIFRVNSINDIKEIKYILDKNNVIATFYIDGSLLEKNKDYFKNNNIYLGYYSYNNKYDELSLSYIKKLYIENNINISNYCLYKNNYFLKYCKKNNISTIYPKVIDNNLYDYLKYKKEKGLIYEIKVNKYNIRELNTSIIYLKSHDYNILSINELLKE